MYLIFNIYLSTMIIEFTKYTVIYQNEYLSKKR